jgi:hypothetical protein
MVDIAHDHLSTDIADLVHAVGHDASLAIARTCQAMRRPAATAIYAGLDVQRLRLIVDSIEVPAA